MPQSTSLYRIVLLEALRLSWRNKFLWVFGFFAAFATGGGVYELVARWLNVVIVRGTSLTMPPIRAFLLPALRPQGSAAQMAAAVGSIIVVVAVMAVFLWAIMISQGALIGSVSRIYRKSRGSLARGFAIGVGSFWRVLALNIASRAGIVISLVVVGGPLLIAGLRGTSASAALAFASFLIFIPLSLVISFLAIYAVAAALSGNLSLGAAVKRSVEFFAENWLISLEMAAILLLANITFGVALVLALVPLSIPFILLFLAATVLGIPALFTMIFVVAAIAFLTLVAVAGSFLSAFEMTSWTLLYLHLSERKKIPKIIRTLRAIPAAFARR